MYVPYLCAVVYRSQKRTLDLLVTVVVMSHWMLVLATEPGSSARAASTLNLCVVSL